MVEIMEKEIFGVLSDNEILSLFDVINFVCENGSEFSKEQQIQPCSVDLRLDNVFWKSKKGNKIDFRHPIIKLNPIYYWDKITLSANEIIELKPGEMIMGRTCEIFSIPEDCYGRIEGKNSNSRIGLGININCSFINPSWRGHMPLQLTNNTKSTMRIIPFMPICQVLFVKLSSSPSLKYGSKAANSTYVSEVRNRPIDDGGPSKWYETVFFESLSLRESSTNMLEKFHLLFSKTDLEDTRIFERFTDFYENSRQTDTSNFNYVVNNFAKRENRLRKKDLFFNKTLPLIALILSGGIGLLLKLTDENEIKNIGLIFCIIIFVLALIVRLLPEIKPYFHTPRTEYLTENKITKHLN